MIDPNLHSCGTVRPHGHAELAHPEAGFYIAGMKSYGRAPTFLMRTGYEQVRSIVAALAGDREAADRVELVLPETGVCSLQRTKDGAAGCCETEAVSQRSLRGTGKEQGRGSGFESPSINDVVVVTESSGCCGGAPVSDPTACCKKDEMVKSAGGAGCGCGSETAEKEPPVAAPGSCCR